MPTSAFATDKQIDAIAYELSERFFKRIGGGGSLQDADDLAAALAAAIREWMGKTPVIGR